MRLNFRVMSVFTVLIITAISGCSSSKDVPQNENSAITETPSAIPEPTVTFTPEVVINSEAPCLGMPAPTAWNHVVVLMFENHHSFIGSPDMPYITKLASLCGTAPIWKDADYRVDGSVDGKYNSKPSYATLTNGLSPTDHGLIDDQYHTKTDVESIFDQILQAGKTFKVYYEGEAGGCSVLFSGAYHDPVRYYNSLAPVCDEHDVPLQDFTSDLNSGALPDFSMIIPSNDHNMHNNTLKEGDTWAQEFLKPILDSESYRQGDLALFFLWDEDSPVPNVLIAPSIVPGSIITSPDENPISHFSALRTWDELLGLSLLGDTQYAPSLLGFYNGVRP